MVRFIEHLVFSFLLFLCGEGQATPILRAGVVPDFSDIEVDGKVVDLTSAKVTSLGKEGFAFLTEGINTHAFKQPAGLNGEFLYRLPKAAKLDIKVGDSVTIARRNGYILINGKETLVVWAGDAKNTSEILKVRVSITGMGMPTFPAPGVLGPSSVEFSQVRKTRKGPIGTLTKSWVPVEVQIESVGEDMGTKTLFEGDRLETVIAEKLYSVFLSQSNCVEPDPALGKSGDCALSYLVLREP